MRVKKLIQQLAAEHYEDIVPLRRSLHRYPELSFQEYSTSEILQNELEKMNIPITAGFIMTGILAVLEGRDPDKRTIALRADMDALPVQEKADHPFRSENSGKLIPAGNKWPKWRIHRPPALP